MNALLALFLRAVRDDVRSKSTYWMRAGFIALVPLFIEGSLELRRWAGAPGLHVFAQVLWMNLTFISLAGLSYFASAITEEKEEDTLSLLRMTQLNPLSILLGKSTGRLTGALLLLAVQLPFTILATSLGGVSLAQIFAAYATLGAYLFFLANLALLFSVACRRTGLAAIWTGLVLMIFFWMPDAIALWRHLTLRTVLLTYDTTATTLEKFLYRWELASPLMRAKEILGTGFHDAPLGWQVWSNLTLGAVCFGLAWACFDRCAERHVEGASLAGGLGARLRRRLTGHRSRPWRRPLTWKDYRQVGGGGFTALVKLGACLGLLGLLFWLFHRFDVLRGEKDKSIIFGFIIMTLMGCCWAVDLAGCAARIFRIELRGQTLSTLAVLPMSLGQIVRQKSLGCLLATWPPVLCALCGFALAAPGIWKEIDHSWRDEEILALATYPAGLVFFVLLVAWLSLRVKFGALPLAAVVSFVGSQVIGWPILLVWPHIRDETALAIALTVFLGGAAYLSITIPRRLAQLAAES